MDKPTTTFQPAIKTQKTPKTETVSVPDNMRSVDNKKTGIYSLIPSYSMVKEPPTNLRYPNMFS